MAAAMNVLTRSLLAAILTILLDQSSKWFAAAKGLIVLNPGAAFSVGGGSSLIVWASVVVLGALFLWWPSAPRTDKVYLAFILAAGVSNLADRLTYGGVRDFIDLSTGLETGLPRFLERFPVFNVADLILSVAAGWLLLHALFRAPTTPTNCS